MRNHNILVSLFSLALVTGTNAQSALAVQNNQSKAIAAPDKELKDYTSSMNDKCDIEIGNLFQVVVSTDGRERQFPFLYKIGSDLFLCYSQHHDSEIASPVDGMVISRDNGKTWGDTVEHADFSFTSMFEKDGLIYGVVYFTYTISDTKERMIYWTSADKGKSWQRHDGVVNAPKGFRFKKDGPWASMLFHRGLQVMEDGSIQGVMYGSFEGDKKYRSVWVKSTDNCASWKIVSTIASGVPEGNFKDNEGYCEPAFAKLKDGSLLCVLRVGSWAPLYQCRSYDNGLTWSKPILLPGLTPKESESVDPQMVLMQNGILALAYGRDGCKIALSTDGRGENWDCHSYVYEGVTTGYPTIVETRPGELLYLGDQGKPKEKKLAIWGKFIQIIPNTK